ncbi:MAG TPA: hypothetical protein VFT95_06810 [Micromonosporaceae bacterium]|nr:hypothetical protein [Micromonosporaceae bacterium]
MTAAPILPDRDGIALVAVGGLGRRECAPRGDLDLPALTARRNGLLGRGPA